MHPARILALLLLGAMLSNMTYADGMRTWRAARGSASIEAELVDVVDGKAELRKSDGNTIQVEIKKLSLADIKHINEVMAAAKELTITQAKEPLIPLESNVDIPLGHSKKSDTLHVVRLPGTHSEKLANDAALNLKNGLNQAAR
jgi:hypothetical protein